MKNKKQKEQRLPLKRIIEDNLLMLKKVCRISPLLVVIKGVKALSNSFINLAYLYFTKMLFDMYEREGTKYTSILILCGVYLGLWLVNNLFNLLCYYILETNASAKLKFTMQRELYEKAASMDLARYDDADFYNDFIWAMSTADSESIGAVDRVFDLISCIITVSGITGLFITIQWQLIPIIIFSVIMGLFFSRLGNKINMEWRDKSNPIDRRKEYSLRVFYLADYAKEIRMSRIAGDVLSDFDDALDEQARLHRDLLKKYFALDVGRSLSVDSVMSMGISVVLIWSIFKGSLTIGSYAASSNAVWQLYWDVRDLIETVQNFGLKAKYIEKYRTFMDCENKIQSGSESLPAFESLKIKGVRFTYDKSENETLHGVDMEIKKGEKIAIVGYNGAGKTTLIKLLMRLYDASDGSIVYNGRDIREYKLDEYRNNFGTVFQDYKLFAATLAENVMGGEYTEADRHKVLTALKNATFEDKLNALKDGIDSDMTREFNENGINLSGGETQKVAIARAFAKNSDIIIMDEPSAALDPISEYELNHSIYSNSKDKTVIFISHRLSTTRMADRIYMFENGKIVESGTHRELMNRNGKYAYMFNLQSEKYKSPS